MHERLANVAVVDEGGRGAGIAEGLAQSPEVGSVYLLGGREFNERLSPQKKIKAFPKISPKDKRLVGKFLDENKVDLLEVSQDDALAAGIADIARARNISTVGPSRKDARIETDKAYGRELAQKAGIQIPEFKVIKDPSEALPYLLARGDKPIWIKAAGLARGKGVVKAEDINEAVMLIRELQHDYPDAMEKFLLEEPINGAIREYSAFYAVAGGKYAELGRARDYKRALNNNEGKNTGGMGSVVYHNLATEAQITEENFIISQTLSQEELDNYQGIIYLGLMETENGLCLVEYNARPGDPEWQALYPKIKNDKFELSMAIAENKLGGIEIEMDQKAVVVVTAAAHGYPGDDMASHDKKIYGIDQAERIEGITLYGAGVKMNDGEEYFIDRGRVLYVRAEADTLYKAQDKAYEALEIISAEDNSLAYRTDIGDEYI